MDANSAFPEDVLLEGEGDPDEDDVYRCPPHDMYLMNAPPVSSLSLLEGWDSKALESLQAAVKAVTQANPLLSGALVEDAEYGPGAVRVEPSRHSIQVHVADVPKSWKPPEPSIRERLTATQDLAPFFEPFDIPMSPKLLETGGPLMGVVVVPLVDGLACLKVSICHLLTDGSAYYMVLKQLDDACHGRSFAPLTWRPSPALSVIPAHYDKRMRFAVEKAWIPGFVRRAKEDPPRRATVDVMIRGAELKALKEDCVTESLGSPTPVAFVSSNDLAQAAVAEVTSAKVGCMYANMRGRSEFKFCTRQSGNFLRSIAHVTDPFRGNPAAVRRILATDLVYFNDERPINLPAWRECDLYGVTNWSSLTQLIEPGLSRCICHCPPRVSVECLPFDAAIVFRADRDGTICLLSNFYRDSAEVQTAIAESKVFRRLFAASEEKAHL